MSKQVNSGANNSNTNNSCGNQNKEKSFLAWVFNSKSKNCDSKKCEDENHLHQFCQLQRSQSNGNTSSICAVNHTICCNSNNGQQLIHAIKPEIFKEISKENIQISNRTKLIKNLTEVVLKNMICYNDAKNLIVKTIDIFNLDTIEIINQAQLSQLDNQISNFNSEEDIKELELLTIRLVVLKMYVKLAKQHYDNFEEDLRKMLFIVLKACIPSKKMGNDEYLNEEISLETKETLLDLFNALTNFGKNINRFRVEIDSIIVVWFDEFFDSELIDKFLNLVSNLIRYNASAFNKNNISSIVKKTNKLILLKYQKDPSLPEIKLCLELYDIIFRYSFVPTDVLQSYIIALCICVNNENLKKMSSKIMKNLINTDICYTVIKMLVENISAELNDNENKMPIICGSVFFISHSLWNSESKIQKLKHQPSYILPVLNQCLDLNNYDVVIHVTNAIKMLVQLQSENLESNNLPLDESNYSFKLPIVYWNHVWEILFKLIKFCEDFLKQNSEIDHFYLLKITNDLNLIVDNIETLYNTSNYFTWDDKMFNFLELYCKMYLKLCSLNCHYPENLIIRINKIIEYYETKINPNQENWLSDLTKMMDQFFKQNSEFSTRIKCLNVLESRIKMNCDKDEDVIIEKIIVPYFKDSENENDTRIKDKIINLIIEVIKQNINNIASTKLMSIISKFLKKPTSRSRNDSDTSSESISDEDSKSLITNGLISIFEQKIYEKNNLSAIESFKLLGNYACSYYVKGPFFKKIPFSIRQKILNFMLSIKVNHDGYIGINKSEKNLEFSQHLTCKKSINLQKSPSANQVSLNPIHTNSSTFNTNPNNLIFSFEEMFIFINYCLSKERDWNLLQIVLENLPALLKNQAIIYSTNYEQTINQICQNCFSLNRDFTNFQTNNFINLPKTIKSADLQSFIFPIFTSLVVYRDYINPNDQRYIVIYTHNGLSSKQCTQQCIIGLTIFITEMPDATSKQLPIILSTLAKTSSSSQLAIPKLEFLSILNLWPNLYSSFIIDQYKYIFAIILPYTNPIKFDEYSVALAYRVAAMWFLSCRYRKVVADYIIRQLPENIKFKQVKENIPYNEEYRKRSSSLNTENDFCKRPQDTGNTRLTGAQSTNNANITSNSNISNGNLHNSPPLPSPALTHHNSNVFNFNMNHDKSPVPSSPSSKQSLHDQKKETIHMQLVECFIDLLSRYVAGNCSTLPNSDPLSNFLFENGLTSTWVIGHKLITITTSSCSSKAVKGDLCEKCHNKLNNADLKISNRISNLDDDVFSDSTASSTAADSNCSKEPIEQLNMDNVSSLFSGQNQNTFLTSRRRHQSAYTPVASSSTVTRKLVSRDDSHIEKNLHFSNFCSSWCPGWAQILIRGPTGNTSWIMKLQNSLNSSFKSTNIVDLLPQYNPSCINRPINAKIQLSNAAAAAVASQGLLSATSLATSSSKLSQISESSTQSSQSTIRGRSNTISFTSHDMKSNEHRISNSWLRFTENDVKSGYKLHPNFVFLQYFHQGTFGNNSESPLLLPKNESFENTLKLFDLNTPYETYKIGIIYIDKKQCKDRNAIFRNLYGSERYNKFIERIGASVKLNELDSQKTFIGGLSQNGEDGEKACIHYESLVQVIFHVASFMPNKKNDPNCTNKIRHIGNNHVCIAYNDSNEDFNFATIKGDGQWLKACVVITPLENEINFVHIQTVPELKEFIFYSSPVMISDHNMPHFVRQLSLNASLVSLVNQSKKQNSSVSPFLSNWVQRICQIQAIKEKVIKYNAETFAPKNVPNTNNNSSNEDLSSVSSATLAELNPLDNFPENFTKYL